jgi:hypothetical protein
MTTPTYDGLKASIQRLKYLWYEGTTPNIVGIRSSTWVPDAFCDKMAVTFMGKLSLFECTTRPGIYWLKRKMNPKGTAVLCPGQYVDSFKVGKHKGYSALIQSAPLKVHRDTNYNAIIDTSTAIDEGYFGIDIHRSNPNRISTVVGQWSAGCQVFANPHELELLLSFCARSMAKAITYTLINEDQ